VTRDNETMTAAAVAVKVLVVVLVVLVVIIIVEMIVVTIISSSGSGGGGDSSSSHFWEVHLLRKICLTVAMLVIFYSLSVAQMLQNLMILKPVIH
jgi:hypothetical protein